MWYGKLEFTAQDEDVLRRTTIGIDEPGTLVRDFGTLLAFVEETNPRLTAGQLVLSMQALEPLNARLSHAIQHGLSRPQQKSYPYINGLYLLLRASGLVSIDASGKKPVLDLFGFAAVRHGAPVAGAGWRVDFVRRTPLGDAMLRLLGERFLADFDNLPDLEHPSRIPTGVLQPLLQPYFPEWHRNLAIPQPRFQDGVMVFKVALDRHLWRRIAIAATDTLDDLAEAILDAYQFDYDHLYRFIVANRFGSQESIYHPDMDEVWRDDASYTSEVEIGELPLTVGQTVVFNYDFGDNWMFDVTLERVEPPDRSHRRPVVLEAQGTAPEQYPGYDDDDEFYGDELGGQA